jgi:hypothetical protein
VAVAIAIAIAIAIFFSEFIFYSLIVRPSPRLRKFGVVHDRIWTWLWQAWERLRKCWDITVWAVLKISEEAARALGARPLDIEPVAVIVEGEGNQGGGGVPTAATRVDRKMNTEASQPPPPYDVST